jgi:hypothetical protein
MLELDIYNKNFMRNSEKRRVYVSGKYGGKQENKDIIEQKIKELIAYDKRMGIENVVYISPVHCFGFLYDEVSYEKGIEMCLELLKTCDEIIFLDSWQDSRGANIEYGFAEAMKIPMYYAKRDNK